MLCKSDLLSRIVCICLYAIYFDLAKLYSENVETRIAHKLRLLMVITVANSPISNQILFLLDLFPIFFFIYHCAAS